ncbi:O-glucosyltransferase rumi-like protein [Bienertia sinuspersici]
MMFTVWGMLQLLKRYPGLVPDVDLMFDCMDKPALNRTEHQSRPLHFSGTAPLLNILTSHFLIGLSGVGPWDTEFRDIKRGSRLRSWPKKWPYAYWKGNPDVASTLRSELLQCNDTKQWRAQILRQNWGEEARAGYKIYAEGYAWSVSLKYILSCGSLTLLISPQYEDFFTRGLLPMKNYWPVPRTDLCPNIRDAAATIGKAGQDFMDTLNMDRVYDYMFHLIMEYSKLQDFKPIPPSSAQEVCIESLLCFAEPKQRQFLEQSATSLSSMPPCALPKPDGRVLKRWKKLKERLKKVVMQT